MNEVEVVTQLITTVGFPIVCCIVMFKQNNSLQSTLQEISNTLTSMNERILQLEKGEPDE
jgi:uncharacterized protein YoxC